MQLFGAFETVCYLERSTVDVWKDRNPDDCKIESKRRHNDTRSVAAVAFLISHLEKYLIFTSNVLISYGEGD